MKQIEQKKQNQELKPYSIERDPASGAKVMRIRARKRGVKLDVKLTLEEIAKLFREA